MAALVVLVGCGERRPPVTAAETPSPVSEVAAPTLPPPWADLSLPNDPVRIIAQSSTSIAMDVPGDSRAVGARYERALRLSGWSSRFGLTMMGDAGTGVFSRTGATLSLAIAPADGGGTRVSLGFDQP